MPITLTVVEGPNAGLSFAFDEHSTFVVGRAPQAHFRLPENDRYFSRNHFLIEVNPPLIRLVDLRSRNGTKVNGVPVQTVDLKDGDRIEGGQTVIGVALRQAPAGDGAPILTPPAGDALSTAPPSSKSPTGFAYPSAAGVTRELSPAERPTAALPERFPTVPGYELLRELGRGGMGVVYQARCRADNNLVAIKTILPAVTPTATTLGRFMREANILRELDHAHIVRFREMGQAGDKLYFIMDFVEGTDAAKLLQAEGPLPLGRAVALVCQLLDALVHAHGKGFIHRDLKPANLLITQVPGRDTVKLADFGLARTYQASQLSGLTMTGKAGGTPAFMPPEQVLDFRSAQPAADQYSAAATLYNLLTGRLLYDGVESNLDLLTRILQEDPVPIGKRRPDLPAALSAAIDRALNRRPEERFPGVGLLRQALLAFAEK